MITPLEAKQHAWRLGHFWAPDNPNGWEVPYESLDSLPDDDERCVLALRSLSLMQATDYVPAALVAHGRQPDFDGELGPAMEETINSPRCMVPDFYPPKDVSFSFTDDNLQEVFETMQIEGPQPAVGTGNWKQCHGVGNFHSASVRVNQSGIGGHLQPVFKEVLTRVQQSYAKIGLLFHFIDSSTRKDLVTGDSWDGNYNLEFSFVQRSSGWIGLAIIGNNQTCQSNIWCQYLASYRGADVVREWVTLVKHELGHNCGREHTSGGVMNPSIVTGLPTDWSTSDPSYNWLRGRFGGEPVGVLPSPNPRPPVDSLEARVADLERKMQSQQINDLVYTEAIRDLYRRINT